MCDSVVVAEVTGMMRRQSAQEQVFYSFRLEDRVPGDHLLRQIDLVLNFDRARSVLAGHYSSTGRPSIDPEVMLRILLICYVYGIRSERLLCSEIYLNLADRWFCRLVLRARCRIIPCSRRTVTAGFARVIFTEYCLRMLLGSAAVQGW